MILHALSLTLVVGLYSSVRAAGVYVYGRDRRDTHEL